MSQNPILRFYSTLTAIVVLAFHTSGSAEIITFYSSYWLNQNATTDAGDDFEKSIATNGDGLWIAVWASDENLNGTAGTDFDIFFATSSDEGANWTNPQLLNSNGTSDTGDDRLPIIIVDNMEAGAAWGVVWQSQEDLDGTAGTDWDIFHCSSFTNGATWTDPALLNSFGTTEVAIDFGPTVASDGDGNWVCTWDSDHDLGGTIGTDADILYSRSSDAGETWSSAAPLNTNADTDPAGDFDTHIATDGNDNWVTVWSSGFDFGGPAGGDADIVCSVSTDNGMSWSAPSLINTNANSDTQHDNFPQIAYDSQGSWVVVWDSLEDIGGSGTDSDIFSSLSTDVGANWADPLFVSEADSDNGSDFFPTIKSDGPDRFLVAWHSDDDAGGTIPADNDIFVTFSVTGGESWFFPFFANDNGEANDANENGAAIAADGDGNWVFAWHSDEANPAVRGTLIGSDFDLMYTNFGFTFLEALSVPFYLDNASNYDGGSIPADGTASFVGVKNSNDFPVTIFITYTDTDGNDHTPETNTYIIPANSMVSWRPFADDPIEGGAGQAVPNADGGPAWGSVLIQSNYPLTGRLIHVDGILGTTGLMVLPSGGGTASLAVPFYLDNASNYNGGSIPSDGTATFIGVKNMSPVPITLTITYTDTDGNDHTPVTNTYALPANSMVSWRPFADDPIEGGAGQSVPNTASGPAWGSAQIEADGPITGRMITIDGIQNSTALMVLPLEEASASLRRSAKGELRTQLIQKPIVEKNVPTTKNSNDSTPRDSRRHPKTLKTSRSGDQLP